MPVDPPAKPATARRVVNYVLSQWFIAGLGLAIGLAAAFPKVGMTGGYIRAEWSIKWGGTALIFFLTGLALSTEALVKQAKNYRLHITTQIISFLGFSSIVYAIVAIIRASHTTKIDPVALAGIILMSVLPTPVGSNIIMTGNAGGNMEAATIEVCIGNILAIFVAPLLLFMYLQERDGWGFIHPRPANGNGLTTIYKEMAEQFSATLFAPLIAGQLIRNRWEAETKKYSAILRLNIVNQILVLLIIWARFCNNFATHAFDALTHQSLILIWFLGIGLYTFFTAICLVVARLPFLGAEKNGESTWKHWLRKLQFDKKDTAAICFCAAAKGLVLGAPMIAILYGGYDERTQAIMSTPIVLYQIAQIFLAQLSVKIFKHWIQLTPESRSDIESTGQSNEKIASTLATLEDREDSRGKQKRETER